MTLVVCVEVGIVAVGVDVGALEPVVEIALQLLTMVAVPGPFWMGLHPGNAGRSLKNMRCLSVSCE